MMRRESREVWAKRVQRWTDSDLTAKQFAAELGINAGTLTYWKYRLGKESGRAAPRRPVRPTASRVKNSRAAPGGRRKQRVGSKGQTSVGFVELATVAQHDIKVEVQLRCGRRLLAPATMAPATLVELADLLERNG